VATLAGRPSVSIAFFAREKCQPDSKSEKENQPPEYAELAGGEFREREQAREGDPQTDQDENGDEETQVPTKRRPTVRSESISVFNH